jgi:hypothetical protein
MLTQKLITMKQANFITFSHISALVFSFLVLFCCVQKLNAQTLNNNIVNDHNSWAILCYGFGYQGTICNVETEYVFFEGDIIINDKSYKQIYSCTDKLHQNVVYKGLMREEDQKVYFFPVGKEKEYLIYDFSLKEGMSIDYEDYICSLPWTIPLYVKSVDFIEINGEMKKRIQFGDPNYDWILDTWIEGIGSMNGILYPCYNLFSAGGFSSFLCYFQDDELIYKHPEYSGCYYDNVEDLFPKTIVSDRTWHIEYGYPCPAGEDAGCYCYKGLQTIKIGNNKTFNGVDYYELLTDKTNLQWELITYVREQERRVYFYEESCNKEYLMYDFNLVPGFHVSFVDPLHPLSLFNQENPCELTEEDLNLHEYFVTQEDKIEYDGVKRKRLTLDHQWPSNQTDIWVEGVGSMRGITYQVTQQMSEVYQLKDCYDADKLIFVNENPGYCWVEDTVGIQNHVFVDAYKTLFPNPAKDYLHSKTEKQFEIIDMQGRVLLKSEKTTKSININHLKTGIYFIKFEDGCVEKFVKE